MNQTLHQWVFGAMQAAEFFVPLVVGAQAVALIGPSDNRLWLFKELIGSYVALLCTIPFAVVLYPESFNYYYVPMTKWVLRAAGVNALIGLYVYAALTAYGITKWGWHGADELVWRRFVGEESSDESSGPTDPAP